MSEVKMSDTQKFEEWYKARCGHPLPVNLGMKAVLELKQENAELREVLQQHRRFCIEVVSGYEGVKFYEKTKQLLKND